MLTWMDSLKGRSMMRLASFTDEEMLNLIDLAAQLKARRAAGVRGDLLHRKNIALIFEKSSTRTRNSTLIAVRDEGGNGEYLTRPDIHFGKKESVKDTARVLGRIYDGILFRGFRQSDCEALAKYSGVPVWNGLTDDYHPTQIFAVPAFVADRYQRRIARPRRALLEDERDVLPVQEVATHACGAASLELRREVDEVDHLLVGERGEAEHRAPLERIHPGKHVSRP